MQRQLKRSLLKIGIFLACVALLGAGGIAWRLYANGIQVYTLRTAQIQELMRENPQFFDAIFMEILPEGRGCTNTVEECMLIVRAQLHALTSSTATASSGIAVPGYFGDVTLDDDQPMYFIALDQDMIVKLFFSGDVVSTSVVTHKETLARDLLLGKREKLYGLQANIKGLRMTYLNDLYSEAEVIVPYVRNGEIIGAVVYLHGD